MTGQRELASAAQREAVDRRDDRLPEELDLTKRRLAQLGGGFALERRHHGQLVDVGAGHERLIARAGQDHDAHAGVVPERGEGRAGFPHGRFVQGIQDLGAVDRDARDPVLDLDGQVFIGVLRYRRHGPASVLRITRQRGTFA